MAVSFDDTEAPGNTVPPGEAAQMGEAVQTAMPPLLSGTWLPQPTCAEAQMSCDGHCADFNIDSENCGGCGIVCGEGKHCQLAECVDECPP